MPLLSCEELNTVWSAKKSLEREQRRLIDLQVIAQPSAPQLDGLPHAKSQSSVVEQLATKMIECQQTIARLNELVAQRKFSLLERLQALNLNELQERVLLYHYVSCLKFTEIAKLMKFTIDYIHFLHRHGLKSLGLTLDEMKREKKKTFSV